MAYPPKRKLTVAIVTTAQPRGASSGERLAAQLFSSLNAYPTPGDQAIFPGWRSPSRNGGASVVGLGPAGMTEATNKH